MSCFVWMQENWDRISETFSASSLISDFVKSIVPLFTSKEKEAEISQFFATRTKPGFERTLKQSLENVRINARWIECIRGEPGLAQTVHELINKL
ncbi:hypothetical protein GUJ93_ZPchr0002g23792 [Zizania palustris]|uniref:ERAP1-like C-terminal domain-containing protein n=1 Tax=Zizania palustris TaxID=103762 RepID=A0A8J5SJA2_ZIZPA|nr:hypothetical protein GUJ93_ZPchr0002g23792 [Zizania palustris]